MGNVPAKEVRGRSGTFSSITSSLSDGHHGRGRRNTTSLIQSTYQADLKKSKRQEEKDRVKELHYLGLIVRFTETVDGGYLAPYGTYKSNLDYDTEVVKNLIINRQLAPFYTPLQDFDSSWNEEELMTILLQLTLHSIEIAYSEEEEDDIDNHKIHKTAGYYKRKESKEKLQRLISKVKEIQLQEEEKFFNEKLKLKEGSPDVNSNIPSKDLLKRLYQNATECPICFLYYPNSFNISRCCYQPICTECFVQIKRLDPHPPHDEENDETRPPDALPHTLISEPASCPYCASKQFGVTYEPPSDINTGLGGIDPLHYSAPFKSIIEESALSSTLSASETQLPLDTKPPAETEAIVGLPTKKPRRKYSVAADAPGVITTDMIRPDWELKLITARNKLARKAATASAIHASNLIVNDSSTSSTHRASRNTNSSMTSAQLQSAEERMLQDALRLSLIDEEERKIKEELNKRRSPTELPME